MSRTFDLVVFDWDGTLMDSAASIVACVQSAAVATGLPPPAAAAVRNVIGLSFMEGCRLLFPGKAPDAYRRLAAVSREHFLLRAPQPPNLFEGVVEVLEDLGRKGYRLAVATGKSRAGLRTALQDTGLVRFMDTSRCADETASKPDPRMLLEIMDELETVPARTLMVGDTEYDLQMARNAGTAAIGVGYGVHESARLLTYEPLACLSAISELPQILEKI